MTILRITDIEITRHAGPVSGVASARDTWRTRQGLLLRLRDDRGQEGLGEASPLPGHSPDRLDDCEAQLRALDYAEISPAEPMGAPAQDSAMDARPLRAALARATRRVSAPAARFAIETAILDLLARRAGQPLWQLLRALLPRADVALLPPPGPVALNAVCTELDPDRAADQVARAHDRGIRCFKLKVGRDFEREMAVLEAARARHGDHVALRADANQAWPPDLCRAHLERLAAVAPEYVEEPMREPISHLAGLAPLPVPVALDESLTPRAGAPEPPGVDELLTAGPVSVLVLKPMLLGGLVRALDWAGRGRARDIDPVVSHLFDGPVALAACAHLAVALAAPRACGLDRHAGLDAWPELDIPYLGPARIDVPAQAGLGISMPAGAAP